MRLPNGYGSVVKLSGKRRKPFMVRKTVGYDERAYPKYAVIGYYKTRADAMNALAQYNNDPYDVDLAKSTFSEVYEMLKEQQFPKMGDSLVSQHKASYKYCKPLYEMQYKNIRKFHFQSVIDNCGKGHSTQEIIKNLFKTMDKFAYDLEIINKMRSANLTTSTKEATKERVPFTAAEVKVLWEHNGDLIVDETLFMLYTGCRVGEMLTVECADIDLKQGTFVCGIKTEAGKNRVIPIHKDIRPIIERYLSDSTYLFPNERSATAKNPEKALETRTIIAWGKKMESLGMDHRTHDCRHTIRSKLDGQNKVCINLIMGHKSGDIGERVYTHKTVQELKEVMDSLDYGISAFVCVSNTLVTK